MGMLDFHKSGRGESISNDVEPLLRELQADSLKARKKAAKALGKTKDTRAVDPLVAALRDEEWDVRATVARALGKIEDPRGVKPLVSLLTDNVLYVRLEAALALDQLGWHAEADSEKAAYFVARGDWKACARIGPAAVEALIAVLRLKNLAGKSEAACALGQIGDPRAVTPLIAALRLYDGGFDVGQGFLRSSAAVALGRIKDPRAVEPLIEALKQRPDKFDCGAQAEALREITGQKFHIGKQNPEKWRLWWEQNKESIFEEADNKSLNATTRSAAR